MSEKSEKDPWPSKKELETSLRKAFGYHVYIRSLKKLEGGMVNTVFLAQLHCDPGDVILKVSPNPKAFHQEAKILQWLKKQTSFPVPDVYAVVNRDEESPMSMIVLEKLPGMHLGQARQYIESIKGLEEEIAETLAELHQHTRSWFGSLIDGEHHPTWALAFKDLVEFELNQEIVKERLGENLQARCREILKQSDTMLNHQIKPHLIHGDIWAGNIMVHQEKETMNWKLSGFIDCHCHYADPEFELAYIMVFQTLGEDFFHRYQELHEINPGFLQRRHLYDLRTMLVHVRHFPDFHYLDMTKQLVQRLEKTLGVISCT